MKDIEKALYRITKAKRVGDGWIGLCPFHQDTNASFKIWDTGSFNCLGCGAKGNWKQFQERISLITPEQIITRRARQLRPKCCVNLDFVGTIVAEYIYNSEHGVPLHKTVRFEPKAFRQMRWDKATLSWKWGLGNCRVVLYHLDLMQDWDWVIIVEGEKDADNLIKLGLPATTKPMGGNGWRPEFTKQLAHLQHVIIVPDNDETGMRYALEVNNCLRNANLASRILRVPDNHKDVSDWLANGASRDDIYSWLESRNEETFQ